MPPIRPHDPRQAIAQAAASEDPAALTQLVENRVKKSGAAPERLRIDHSFDLSSATRTWDQERAYPSAWPSQTSQTHTPQAQDAAGGVTLQKSHAATTRNVLLRGYPTDVMKKPPLQGLFGKFKEHQFNDLYEALGGAYCSEAPLLAMIILRYAPEPGPKQNAAIKLLKEWNASPEGRFHGETFHLEGMRYSLEDVSSRQLIQKMEQGLWLLENSGQNEKLAAQFAPHGVKKLLQMLIRSDQLRPQTWEILTTRLETLLSLVKEGIVSPAQIGSFCLALNSQPQLLGLLMRSPEGFTALIKKSAQASWRDIQHTTRNKKELTPEYQAEIYHNSWLVLMELSPDWQRGLTEAFSQQPLSEKADALLARALAFGNGSRVAEQAKMLDTLHAQKEKRIRHLESLPMAQRVAMACSGHQFAYQTSNFMLLKSMESEIHSLGIEGFAALYNLTPDQILRLADRMMNYEALPGQAHAILKAEEMPAMVRLMARAYIQSDVRNEMALYQFANSAYACVMNAGPAQEQTIAELKLGLAKIEDALSLLNETVQDLQAVHATYAQKPHSLKATRLKGSIEETQLLVLAHEEARATFKILLESVDNALHHPERLKMGGDVFDPAQHRDPGGYLSVAHVFNSHDTDQHFDWTKEEMRKSCGRPIERHEDEKGVRIVYEDRKNKTRYTLYQAKTYNSGADFSHAWVKEHAEHGGIIVARCHAGYLNQTLPSDTFKGVKGNFVAVLNNCYSSSNRLEYVQQSDPNHVKFITNDATGYGAVGVKVGGILAGLTKKTPLSALKTTYAGSINSAAKKNMSHTLSVNSSDNMGQLVYARLYLRSHPLPPITDSNLLAFLPSYWRGNMRRGRA